MGTQPSAEQEKAVLTAQRTSLKMCAGILKDLDSILQQEPPNEAIKRREAWLAHEGFKTYFGMRDVTTREIQLVRERVAYIQRRLESGLHLVIIPDQSGASAVPCKPLRNAYAWWPRRIYLCPRWFKKKTMRRAAILVHEVAHQIGVFGQGHYGATDKKGALALAKRRPKLARKSPENYEALAEMYAAKP